MSFSTVSKTTWNELFALLRDHRSFLISSHVNPDGDCIGSQLALAWYLRSRGKEVVVYNADAVPNKLAFLEGSDLITNQRPARTFDVVAVVDASNPDRLGWTGYQSFAPKTVNIDHHRDNTRFADLNIVTPEVAATGVLLYQFFTSLSIEPPPAVAQALYAAIMTDTGGFRFGNTNGQVLRICADLADKGANCAEVYKRIYASYTPAGLILKSRIWSSLRFYNDNRVCSMEMPLDLAKQTGATYGDSEGMADYTIVAEGVEVGMLLKFNQEKTHFSLRSTGRVDVGKIARGISGGGGHSNAAGCTMQLPIEEARVAMLAIIGGELDRL